MSTETFSNLAGLAAFLAIGIGVVALAIAFVPAVADRLGGVGTLLRRQALSVSFAVALASTLGSLYYSEIADFVPCDYCWYQRIMMYPLVIVFGVAMLRRDRTAVYTALPLAVIGLGIAIYHYQIQLFPDQDTSCNLFAPCSQRWVDTYGVVSIPFMAGAGFLAIIGLCALSLRSGATAGATEQHAARVDGDIDDDLVDA